MRHDPGLNRNFRINGRSLEKYSPTMGCKGCENKMTGDDARPHSSECRARLEELMREDDVGVARRDERREQRANVIAERLGTQDSASASIKQFQRTIRATSRSQQREKKAG